MITAETNQGALALLFEDCLPFVAHGNVIASIDMSKIRPEDLWLDGNRQVDPEMETQARQVA